MDHKMIKNIPLDGLASLLNKVANNYLSLSQDNKVICENKQTYNIISRDESYSILSKARQAALESFASNKNQLVKIAFDTRRINQETDRNPRINLQYWNRSDEFISDEDQNKINILSKLVEPLNELKNKFGSEPDWHESYSRFLYDAVNRILRVKQADKEYFGPQMAYLEQLLDARYRLSLEKINKMATNELKDVILRKDETLQKKGLYLPEPIIIKDSSLPMNNVVNGDSNLTNAILIQNALSNLMQQNALMASAQKKDGEEKITPDNVSNAIFGQNTLRRSGEKEVERTITITIRDKVVE
jgi:hypothetical protein